MKMALKPITQLSSVLFAVAFLAACSSTETADSTAQTSDTQAGTSAVASPTTADGELRSESIKQQDRVQVPLKTVFYFDFDQSALKSDTRAALDDQIAALLKTSGIVRLEGHADARGTREYNLALGERRAKAVANYMAIQGISRSRIETISYGEEKPVAFGETEQSWALNRRVEIR